MNDEVQDALCPNGCKSIIDTGTYLIYGPSDQLQSFLSDMTIKTCDDKANLPNLGFMFKGFKKDGKDTAFELILTPDEYVLEFDVDGKPDCVVGIGSDTEDSGWTVLQRDASIRWTRTSHHCHSGRRDHHISIRDAERRAL